jgi:putative lipoic acid-binding regulatory protein
MSEEPITPGSTPDDDPHQRSVDLLNATHSFPCPVMVKVIGNNQESFVDAVVSVIRDELELAFDPSVRRRETRSGKHVSLTIEPTFDDAEQVLSLYEKIRKIDGVIMLL